MNRRNRKRIVYLFGAGATQAEIDLTDNTIRTLTEDIRAGIFDRITSDSIYREKHPSLVNQVLAEDVDLEHLIALYESSGNFKHTENARVLRRLFREVLQEYLNRYKKASNKGASPSLYAALIDMHNIEQLEEEIAGVLTLNYDDVLEHGVLKTGTGIDYSIKTKVDLASLAIKNDSRIQIIKLHGSFNWRNEFPITVTEANEIEYDEDVLWVPPSAEKKLDKYPFGILWDRAMEILDCDVLRVVGCSLNRNDWQLISLLYATQQLNASGNVYTIELINRYRNCRAIRDQYRNLLFIKMITELQDVRTFITNSSGLDPDQADDTAIDQYFNRQNVFDLWLRSKAESLREQGASLGTPTRLFEKYIKSEGNYEDKS